MVWFLSGMAGCRMIEEADQHLWLALETMQIPM
jgi:hypothetical protein